MRLRNRLWPAGVAVALVVGGTLLAIPATSSAAGRCGPSGDYTVCLQVPDGPLRGNEQVTATLSGGQRVPWEVLFSYGPTAAKATHLLSDFEAPYTFRWPTDKYLDGTGVLTVQVKKTVKSTAEVVSAPVTLSNGNSTTVPRNPSNWAELFDPRPTSGDPVVAAVGDGGDGTQRSDSVAQAVLDSAASVLLYLGDMYDEGTPAEWENNYGRASFDPAGGTAWGRLARFTSPTLGNHEAHDIRTWRDYWHGRPNYTTFVFGGVRYLNLNSECGKVGGCAPGSRQYAFVADTLRTNQHDCVVAFWHRPVLSAVQDSTAMRPIWALLANNGGDLVLTGHTHHMAEYRPLNDALQPGQPDSHQVQLISGGGSHAMLGRADSDSRAVWQAGKTAGALYLAARGANTGEASALDWTFRDTQGQVVTTAAGPGAGHISC